MPTYQSLPGYMFGGETHKWSGGYSGDIDSALSWCDANQFCKGMLGLKRDSRATAWVSTLPSDATPTNVSSFVSYYKNNTDVPASLTTQQVPYAFTTKPLGSDFPPINTSSPDVTPIPTPKGTANSTPAQNVSSAAPQNNIPNKSLIQTALRPKKASVSDLIQTNSMQVPPTSVVAGALAPTLAGGAPPPSNADVVQPTYKSNTNSNPTASGSNITTIVIVVCVVLLVIVVSVYIWHTRRQNK